MQVLDNRMFDNGSFECFNFWLADLDGCNQVDSTHPVISECRAEIEAAMSRGDSYIQIKSGLVYGGLPVLEIQWG